MRWRDSNLLLTLADHLEMPDPYKLAELRRAVERKRRAEDGYRAALVTAFSAGADCGMIGRAAGITRQGAWKMLQQLKASKPQP
jgi:hypothetical protein